MLEYQNVGASRLLESQNLLPLSATTESVTNHLPQCSKDTLADPRLSIPEEQRYLIARVAEQTPARAAKKAAALEQQKAAWRPRKALAREIRERRKAYW